MIAGGDEERVRRLVERAHDTCYVPNTLSAEVSIEPTIEFANESEGDV
jgi:uncharacterized OsmC-like protein